MWPFPLAQKRTQNRWAGSLSTTKCCAFSALPLIWGPRQVIPVDPAVWMRVFPLPSGLTSGRRRAREASAPVTSCLLYGSAQRWLGICHGLLQPLEKRQGMSTRLSFLYCLDEIKCKPEKQTQTYRWEAAKSSQ